MTVREKDMDRIYKGIVVILLTVVGFFLQRTVSTLDRVGESNVKLMIAVEKLELALTETNRENEEDHNAIITTLNDIDDTMNNHETRITVLERNTKQYVTR